MKKKLVSIVLVLCLLCTMPLLASCEKASDLIEKAMANTEALDDYSATLNMQMKVTVGGQTKYVNTEAKMLVENAKGDNVKMSTEMEMKMLSESVKMKMYMVDNWLYMDMDDAKLKVRADSEMGESYDYSDNMDGMLQDIPAEVLKDVKIEEKKGQKIMTFELDDSTFNDLYDDLLEEMYDSLDGLGVSGKMTLRFSNAVITVAVKDDYLSKYSMSFDMSATVGTQVTRAEVDMTLTFDDPGKDVTVKLPSDLKEYQLVSGL